DVGVFFFTSRRRHMSFGCDWSSDVCSSDLCSGAAQQQRETRRDGAAPEHVRPGEGGGVAGVNVPALGTCRFGGKAAHVVAAFLADRKSVVEGKRAALGGRRGRG